MHYRCKGQNCARYTTSIIMIRGKKRVVGSYLENMYVPLYINVHLIERTHGNEQRLQKNTNFNKKNIEINTTYGRETKPEEPNFDIAIQKI